MLVEWLCGRRCEGDKCECGWSRGVVRVWHRVQCRKRGSSLGGFSRGAPRFGTRASFVCTETVSKDLLQCRKEKPLRTYGFTGIQILTCMIAASPSMCNRDSRRRTVHSHRSVDPWRTRRSVSMDTRG